jgi:hypothetical protein
MAPLAPLGPSTASSSSDVQLQSQEEPGFVPELSTLRSSTYLEPDGSYTLEAYTEPVNFVDASGELKPIDTTLVEAAGSVYDVRTAANSIAVKIPEDPSTDPVKVTDSGEWVALRMLGTGNDPARVVESTATFTDVDGAQAVTYEAVPNGVKESILLVEPPLEAPKFRYEVDATVGLSPVPQTDGSIWFVDTNSQRQFAIPAPYMYDSAPEEPAMSADVAMDIRADGDHWMLSITPDAEWLNSSDRTYPVIVDPTVINKTASSDCWISQADPNNGMCGVGADHLRVGVGETDSLRRRALLNFDVSSIPDQANITDATAHFYLDAGYSSNHQAADYGLYTPSKAWTNAATWNSSGPAGSWTGGSPGETLYSVRSINGSTSGYKDFIGLKGLVEAWLDGSVPMRGVVLKQEYESTRNVIAFYSKAGPTGTKPYLSVEYSTAYPPVGAEVTEYPPDSGINTDDSANADLDTGAGDGLDPEFDLVFDNSGNIFYGEAAKAVSAKWLACDGHAYRPVYTSGTYRTYVSFVTMSHCEGTDYIGMYACMKPQEKSVLTNRWYQRHKWICLPYTVSEEPKYIDRSWSCSDLLPGIYRTRSKTVIDTTRGEYTQYATSHARTMCDGA